jgi:hypothetical protein
VEPAGPETWAVEAPGASVISNAESALPVARTNAPAWDAASAIGAASVEADQPTSRDFGGAGEYGELRPGQGARDAKRREPRTDGADKIALRRRVPRRRVRR